MICKDPCRGGKSTVVDVIEDRRWLVACKPRSVQEAPPLNDLNSAPSPRTVRSPASVLIQIVHTPHRSGLRYHLPHSSEHIPPPPPNLRFYFRGSLRLPLNSTVFEMLTQRLQRRLPMFTTVSLRFSSMNCTDHQ